ncbi:DUF1330 domain-containing protein [Acinetobacter colistiniresistens]|uniref:DUF1330 domain-containing protein n=1 Tax=Acinetobacter colistiniresistens TaxID=280145 RepID=S3TAF6_9GAMM|nr:DUF1330 domain-containing protein [Acinetobacter colistiniresistens]EPG37923.1 hypothetical protein F907_01893 [Acinetobacter colistiniresistens]TVT84718.1 DUF1330 domain-containing protein [Acinetobacter colistiniresistens]
MSAYIILIRKQLKNQDEMKTYTTLARQASQGFDAEPIVFYGQSIALENIESDGVAIIKFSNMQEAQNWYHSDAYQQAKKHRDLAGEYMVILTEGLG